MKKMSIMIGIKYITCIQEKRVIPPSGMYNDVVIFFFFNG